MTRLGCQGGSCFGGGTDLRCTACEAPLCRVCAVVRGSIRLCDAPLCRDVLDALDAGADRPTVRRLIVAAGHWLGAGYARIGASY